MLTNEQKKFLKDYADAKECAQVIIHVHNTYGGLVEDKTDPRDSVELLDGLDLDICTDVLIHFHGPSDEQISFNVTEVIVMSMRFLLEATMVKLYPNNHILRSKELKGTRTESGILVSNGLRRILVPYSYGMDDFCSFAISLLVSPFLDKVTAENLIAISDELDKKIIKLSNEYPDIVVVPGFFIRVVAKLMLCDEHLLKVQLATMLRCFQLLLLPKLKKEYDKKIILTKGKSSSSSSENILQPKLLGRSDLENIIWKKASIAGMKGYLTYDRVDKTMIPMGWCPLELRQNDNGDICQIAETILVDFYGTFLVANNDYTYTKLFVEQMSGGYLNTSKNGVFIYPGTFSYKNGTFINIEK